MSPLQVAVFGCPRSGTSWLGQLFNAHEAVAYRYQPLFSYEFKDWFGRHGLSPAALSAFGEALLAARSAFVLQDLQPPKLPMPSHLVWKEVRYHHLIPALAAMRPMHRIVYLHRAPVQVINSWFQAPKEFRPGQDIHEEWQFAPSKNVDPSEYNGLAKWKESMGLALAVQAAWPDRICLVSYERLRADPAGQLARLFAQVGLPPSAQVQEFVQASTGRHEDDAYSVFRTRELPMRLPADIRDQILADEEARSLHERALALSLQAVDQAG